MSEQKIQFTADELQGPFSSTNVTGTTGTYVISGGGGGVLVRIVNGAGITGTISIVDTASAAVADKCLAAQATSSTATTIVESSSLTNPSYSRKLAILPGGTTGDVAACDITVEGTDFDGKAISEDFTIAENQATATNGSTRFKTVTRVTIPAQDGNSATFDVGEYVGDTKHTLTNPTVGQVIEYNIELKEGLYVVSNSASADYCVVYKE